MRIMTYPINVPRPDVDALKTFFERSSLQVKSLYEEHLSIKSASVLCLLVVLALGHFFLREARRSEVYALSNGVVTNKGLTGPLPGPLLSFKWPGHSAPIAPWALKELERKNTLELEELMLSGVPLKLRDGARLLLPSLLSACERFGVDPFWAMAIMWTESHFRLNAQSYAGAYGPMQIMPATAHYILWRQGVRVSAKEAARLRTIPGRNVDLGVSYLAELLEEFDGNYKLATIAYNMGPYGLKRALASGQRIGHNHRYWKRVIGHLKLLLDSAAPRLGPWRQFNEKTLEEFAVKGFKLPLISAVSK